MRALGRKRSGTSGGGHPSHGSGQALVTVEPVLAAILETSERLHTLYNELAYDQVRENGRFEAARRELREVSDNLDVLWQRRRRVLALEYAQIPLPKHFLMSDAERREAREDAELIHVQPVI